MTTTTTNLERLYELAGVCLRDYRYAVKVGDTARAAKATAELAKYAAELAAAAQTA